ncbi:hypothetical protein Hoch_6259 [Haliangium ochraceum DSM 14365]|uniref:Hedgehog/Intein (Hint) domain-containing protein n=2 Tax=Haliangium ochraceum TaxID=80816 RepID=D0LMP3_HALO1|nr:hypothetical protein Hoch_6259 [Haliangium ochraceum DSM 14365]
MLKTQVMVSVVLGAILGSASTGAAQSQEMRCPILEPANAAYAELIPICDTPLPPDPDPPPPPPPPPDEPCPFALPVPADAWMIECKAIQNGAGRCGSPMPIAVCQEHNDRAYALGLITSAAHTWLENNGFCAINIPEFAAILSICPSGCFEENTALLTIDELGAEEWVAAKELGMQDQLVSLEVDASLSSPQLSARSIERMSVGPEEPPLYVFALSNGHKLRVTAHHAMVLADGRVVEAEQVLPHDAFIGVDGGEVAIEAITREATNADVYNFSVSVGTPQEHVIAAEGVLVGDLTWQSTLIGEHKSIELRR